MLTAQRILERPKFDNSVFLILKPISYFFSIYITWGWKARVGKFMVEKSGVERSGVEAWG